MTRRRQRPGVECLEARWLLTQINEFPVPSSIYPTSITSGPDGNLWFTDNAGTSNPTPGGVLDSGKIGMINPMTLSIAEFPIPTTGDLGVQQSQLRGITTGPDGNLWFIDSNRSLIGMINPTTHAIAEFPTPTANNYPTDITTGPDGNLWFTESGDMIGMINPMTHAIAEFPVPTASAIGGITSGPDGNLWFTQYDEAIVPDFVSDFVNAVSSSRIGMINPTTHAVAEFPLPTADAGPGGITAGPDGNLWFTEFNGSQIGMINPTTHAIAEFTVSAVGYQGLQRLRDITTGPDGNLWFTEVAPSLIGMINPTTHAIAEFPTPTANSYPTDITTGPDGNLWFFEVNSDQLGEVVIAPSITGVVAVTHSKKEITAIILGVNEPLNSASASNRGFYSLDSGVKKQHTLVFSKPARIRTVLYDSTTVTVTLKLAKPSKGPIQVMVHSGVMATNGISTRGTFTAVVK
jgi:virginiamycin B lyase